MFHAVVRVFLKLFELIGCIACVITKNLTDQEARRIEVRNQKYSREWSLLNNVTWSREGNAFASVTYGGYTLITALLLISRCINVKSRPTLTEKIFLTVGMLFFFTIGSLVYASIEQVPPDLHDNALILGTLSYLVAILFLIDLADPMERTTHRSTQTIENEINFNNQHLHNQAQSLQLQQQQQQQQNISTHINYQKQIQSSNDNNETNKDLNISSTLNNNQHQHHHHHQNNNRIDLTPIPSPEIDTIPPHNGYYFPGDQVDVVQTKMLPTREQPIFAKILLPEKKRPFREKALRPIRLYNFTEQQQYRNYFTTQNKDQFYRADARSHYINTNNNNNNDNQNINSYYTSSYRDNYNNNNTNTNNNNRLRDEYPGPLPDKDYFTDDENMDRPLKSGFVAQAARMWDKKAKKTIRKDHSTIV